MSGRSQKRRASSPPEELEEEFYDELFGRHPDDDGQEGFATESLPENLPPGNRSRQKQNANLKEGRAKDPAWRHVTRKEGTNSWTCNHCHGEFSGSVTRIKQHHAGGYINIRGCIEAPIPVREEASKSLLAASQAK